jgi:hypothetical protein
MRLSAQLARVPQTTRAAADYPRCRDALSMRVIDRLERVCGWLAERC